MNEFLLRMFSPEFFNITNLILGAKAALIVWAITSSARYQLLLDQTFLRPWGKSPLLTTLMTLFYEVISCQKCLTFWVVMAITGDFWTAMQLALVAAITSRVTGEK